MQLEASYIKATISQTAAGLLTEEELELRITSDRETHTHLSDGRLIACVLFCVCVLMLMQLDQFLHPSVNAECVCVVRRVFAHQLCMIYSQETVPFVFPMHGWIEQWIDEWIDGMMDEG